MKNREGIFIFHTNPLSVVILINSGEIFPIYKIAQYSWGKYY